MPITKTVYTDAAHNRDIVVVQKGRYHEVAIVQREKKEAADGKHLLVLMPDVSGSMFDGGAYAGSTIDLLNRELTAIAQQALAAEHTVVLLPWAQDVSHWLVDTSNVTTIFQHSVDEAAVFGRQQNKTAGPNEFVHKKWWGATLPRLGFQRLEQIVTNSPEKLASVTVLFATDGAFSIPIGAYQPPAEHLLTDAYLNDLGQFMINCQIPFTLVYLGVVRDHVPDAERIMSVFPNTQYSYAASKYHIRTETPALVNQLNTQVHSNSVFLVRDGKKTFTAVGDFYMCCCDKLEIPGAEAGESQVVANSSFILARERTYAVLQILEDLKLKYFAGKHILQQLLDCDDRLTQINKHLDTLKSNTSDRNRTRQYLYSVMRLKNEMQQLAAKQAHKDDLKNARLVLSKQQDLVMVMQDKFSISIAKQITRNRGRKRDYTVSAPEITSNHDRTTYVTTVKFSSDDVRTYVTPDVPCKTAHDEDTDPITCETFQDIYAAGDTRGQAFLIEKPNEIAFHSPSKIKFTAAMIGPSLQTFYDNVEQRVEVQGQESLFSTPFSGMTSEDKYNCVLPTWAPNLNYVARYTLKPMLGYLIGGHELAYPSRAVDAYIPACRALWNKWTATKSSKDLKEAMLLTQAFRAIKKWTKLGNLADPDAITPEQNMLLFLNGDSGTHAFMSLSEPVLYALMTELDGNAFQDTLLAEQIYKIAHTWGDNLYKEILHPMIKEIIRATNLVESPEFQEIPEWQTTPKLDKLVARFMKNFTLDGNARLHAIASHLTPAVWKYVETEYDIPADLNAALTAIESAYIIDTRQIIPLIAVANEFPSNGTRRGLKKSAADVLRDLTKIALVRELGDIQKEQFYSTRFNSYQETHTGLPLVITPSNLTWFKTIPHLDEDCFIREFHTRFASQLSHEVIQFGLTQEAFYTKLDENLRRLWAKRDTLGDITTSGSALPFRRCGNVLCHQFMVYERTIEITHWASAGVDLPRHDQYRRWVPAMHMVMSNHIHMATQQEFVDTMTTYARKFVTEDFISTYRSYFEWHYTEFH